MERDEISPQDIIEMARQAGFETMLRKGKILGFDRDGDYTEELEAFAKLVAEAAASKEREACLKICEAQAQTNYWEGADVCAEDIRARGEAQ